ncbi:TSUP family transporter [Vibrio mangrovi]|uniref:Probable membrane transporter protein n=1 Tax=Vibrio mangrovi TaxID=474394 RepID=A0A1Y6IR86_9VIBR|nr:TSUP family transporter [Vibrio mangrovi]MDW6001835.1 TSUP family transporter [Vibrio mangrovi]SMS00138.1 hypothetical protein VIM7927_01379 [Vibrio mangrovi]
MNELLWNLSDHLYLWLFVVAMVAGVIDSIAGGGGLLTVPALLLGGMSPVMALGTNRFQAVIGETTAFLTFWRYRQIQMTGLMLGVTFTAGGAVLGSYTVRWIDKSLLEMLIPVLMVAISIYSVFSGRLKQSVVSEPRISRYSFMLLCGVVIGFYNGFFGPGTGSIWIIAFITLLGLTIKQASVMTKPLNLTGNAVSLCLFISFGYVDYMAGIVMGFGQVFGAIIGSKIVISNGDRIVRPVFISVTLLMTCKLVYEQVSADSLSGLWTAFIHFSGLS